MLSHQPHSAPNVLTTTTAAADRNMPRSPSMPSLVAANKANGSLRSKQLAQQQQQQQLEVIRKRQYRIGLNIFNITLDKGIDHLIKLGFIEKPVVPYDKQQEEELCAATVARFFLTRKGISKKKIGEYLGNIRNDFNRQVLVQMLKQFDFSGLPVDVALRNFQTTFTVPGEAQQVERIVDEFALRYIECNPNPPIVRQDPSNVLPLTRDDVSTLAFAIFMLNTDQHNPNVKQRMTLGQFIKNLSGDVFKTGQLSDEFLAEVYDRVKNNELRTGPDHVTQVRIAARCVCVICVSLSMRVQLHSDELMRDGMMLQLSFVRVCE